MFYSKFSPEASFIHFFCIGKKKDLTSNLSHKYYDLEELISPEKYNRLPYSVRVLLESAVRNCDNFQVSEADVNSIVEWEKNQGQGVEIRFRPARVILQDFTGN